MEKARRLLKFLIGFPLTLLSFLFIFKILYDSKSLLIESLSQVNFFLFFLGIFFFALFFFIKSLAWIKILNLRGHKLELRKTLYQYSLSEIKRYIPLNLMSYVARVTSLNEKIPGSQVTKAIGIEAVLMVLSSFFVSIPAVLFFLSNNKINIPEILLIVLFFIFLICLLSFKKTCDIIFKYLNTFLLLSFSWIVFGLACFFIAVSLTFISTQNLIQIVSLFVLSWLAGFLAFVTPMGLGVRELAITQALTFFLPLPISSIIAIVSRISMILGEMVFVLFSKVLVSLKNNSKLLRIDPHMGILAVVSVIYFSYFSIFTVLRHNNFMSGRFDLGNMTQTVWNTSRGNFFMLTNPDGTQNLSRLAIHSDFILIFFSPFYWIWSSPEVLLIGQSLILAFSGIFVYLISLHILKNKNLSLVLSISFYLNFWLHEENIFDFHAVTLATTFLLATFFFLLKKNYKLFFVFLFLSVITKENIFLIASIFGLYMILKTEKKIIGISLAIFSFLMFFFLSSYAISNARGQSHFALGSYEYLGNSAEEVVKNIFLKPDIVFGQLYNFSTLEYLNYHLAPTGYLALLSPIYLVFTIPEAAIYLLSSNFEYRSYQYHFGAAMLPFIYIATIYSIKFLNKKFNNTLLPKFLPYYIGFASVFMFYNFSPVVGMKQADNNIFEQNNAWVLQELKIIPETSSVASSNNVGAHLSHRDYIYVVPFGMDRADYIVLYEEKPEIISKINTKIYKPVLEKDSLFIYKRN